MSWNYRVMKNEPYCGNVYAIHEVYSSPDGVLWGHSERATGCMGDTLADLRSDLEMRLHALSKPVLEWSEEHGYRELPDEVKP